MAKQFMPVIMMMFAIVLLSAIAVTLASYYGGSWTWIAQQNASLVLVLITLGLATFVLVTWLRGKR